MPGDEASRIRTQAQDLLRSGRSGSGLGARSGRAGMPLAVHAPDGKVHSWFVPVTVGDQLAGYFQFLPDETIMGYSSFQRQGESLDGAPAAESWTDPEAIRRQAQTMARPGETAGAPYLTYDQAPSRLAWAVPLTSPGGTRLIFVAGPVTWEAPPRGSDIQSYGGPQPDH